MEGQIHEMEKSCITGGRFLSNGGFPAVCRRREPKGKADAERPRAGGRRIYRRRENVCARPQSGRLGRI
ncbi:hypothetical protein D3C71_1923730 [compost metagenome]